MNTRHSRIILLVLGLSLPLWAQAHPGHDFGMGLLSGALHPLTGIDHLLAMLAIGAWSAQRGGRTQWMVTPTWLLAMTGGAVLGFSGLPLAMTEQAIAASVLVFGLLVVSSARLSTTVGIVLAAAFAVFHGYAHAVESTSAAAVSYVAGMVLSSAALQLVGFTMARWLQISRSQQVLRWSGALIAGYGAMLLVAG